MTASIRSSLAVLALLVAPAASMAQQTPAAEPAPAPAEAKPTPPPEPPKPPPPPSVTSKFNVSFYGFVVLDAIHDSTRTFDIGMGGSPIARPNTLNGENGRSTVTARESRFGFRITAPEYQGMKVTGLIEADFDSQGGATNDGALAVGGLRMRQANLKLETKAVDVLLGQTAFILGWNPFFFPATVSNIPLPGQAFGRNAQLRLSKFMKGDALSAEVAVAALRPPQRDAEIPEFQAGVRFLLNNWKGIHTLGNGGTAAYPLSLGVSGAYRKFKVNFSEEGLEQHDVTGQAVSIDALIPVLPARGTSKGNSLTLTGTFVTGKGFGDLIGNLAGGPAASLRPALATGTSTNAVDWVTFDAARNVEAVQWQGFVVGGDYYLPPNGRLFVSGLYAQVESDNVGDNVTPGVGAAGNQDDVFDKVTHYEGNVFFDVTPAVRLGVNYQHREQEFLDGVKAENDRFQVNALYFF